MHISKESEQIISQKTLQNSKDLGSMRKKFKGHEGYLKSSHIYPQRKNIKDKVGMGSRDKLRGKRIFTLNGEQGECRVGCMEVSSIHFDEM